MQGTGTSRRKLIITTLIFVVAIALLILIDQLTKLYFKTNYTSGDEKYVIGGFFYFTYTFNTGAAFSFLSGKAWAQTFFKVLSAIAIVAFILLFIFARKRKYKVLSIALVFVISGTIGNFIDRIRFDGVVDFIGLIFFGWRFPVFNVADICMCVGVIMVIVHFLFLDKNALFKKNGKKKLSNNDDK